MSQDENALAEQESGDRIEDRNGIVDPGYESEHEAQEVGEEGMGQEEENLSSVQKRIHAQAKKHRKEIRDLNERIQHMQSMMSGDSANPANSSYNTNPYASPGQPNPAGMSEEEKIHHAVRLALGMKDQEERQAKEAEHKSHVHKQYQRLNDEFDRASDKYDDFDDVVRGDDMPFTPHVRDALLLVDNPAEVAYKLGKNRSELERISKLHPLDQAREVNKLSFSLMGGNSAKAQNSHKSTPMGSIRHNPATSSGAVTDKTPASSIRARMKAGTWK